MPSTTTLVHKIFDQAFNQGNLAVVDELISLDAMAYAPGWGIPTGRLGLKQLIASLRMAFPDLQCVVNDEIECQNRAAALWTLRGTHHGAFFRTLPTGKPVEVKGLLFANLENQQITKGWLMIDQMSMLQQIGAVPPIL
ncbi:MAG: ester cyclase [Candidatus Promineifilaceae bacterium]